MGSTWAQLLMALLAVLAVFVAAALGVLLLAWAPLRGTGSGRAVGRWQSVLGRLRGLALRLGVRVWSRVRRWRVPSAVTARLSGVGRHPARLVVLGFAVAVLVGSALLSLPFATESGRGAPPVTAVFTATSAVCVTGLVIEDTGTYWSGFGQAVILGLIQIGGLGIMTLASLLGLLVARRLRMRLQLGTQAETKALGVGDVRRVVFGVVGVSVIVEVAVATVLTWRFADGYGETRAASG